MDVWSVVLDLGFISLLLLVGTLVRAKVKFIQALFLPASVIAGILGLALGQHGLKLIPFSNALAQYPDILIAVVFAGLPFTSELPSFKRAASKIARMWVAAESITILEWALGTLFALTILTWLFGHLPSGFGFILATGFVGGHGTAAALASAFGDHWAAASSLGFTSATVGIVAAIVGGIIIIQIESRRGNGQYIASFKSLPPELRTGMVPSSARGPIGVGTTSGMSIDPLIFHASVLIGLAAAGYGLSTGLETLIPTVTFPVFSLAFILGYVALLLFKIGNVNDKFDPAIFQRVSGAATDVLVVSGIAAINPSIVAQYALPLALLLTFGILLILCFYIFWLRRLFTSNRVEQSVFTWGWATGTVAMGIALLRIIDPELKSGTLDYYGVAYIPVGIVDVIIVAVAPALAMSGFILQFGLTTLAIGAVIILVGWVFTRKRSAGVS